MTASYAEQPQRILCACFENTGLRVWHLGSPVRHSAILLFYGIDFPSSKELVASGKSLDDIAEWIGVDHLIYLDESDLTDAIDNNICMGCINGCYPTERKGHQEFSQYRRGHDTI